MPNKFKRKVIVPLALLSVMAGATTVAHNASANRINNNDNNNGNVKTTRVSAAHKRTLSSADSRYNVAVDNVKAGPRTNVSGQNTKSAHWTGGYHGEQSLMDSELNAIKSYGQPRTDDYRPSRVSKPRVQKSQVKKSTPKTGDAMNGVHESRSMHRLRQAVTLQRKAKHSRVARYRLKHEHRAYWLGQRFGKHFWSAYDTLKNGSTRHKKVTKYNYTRSTKPASATNNRVANPGLIKQSGASQKQESDWFRDGLSDGDFMARQWIARHESSYRWTVKSYGSTCVGYFQLSPSYLGYHKDGRVNMRHKHQVKVADLYALNRYGSWRRAKRFWEAHHWY